VERPAQTEGCRQIVSGRPVQLQESGSGPDPQTRRLGESTLPLVKSQELVRTLHQSSGHVQQIERADSEACGMRSR